MALASNSPTPVVLKASSSTMGISLVGLLDLIRKFLRNISVIIMMNNKGQSWKVKVNAIK